MLLIDAYWRHSSGGVPALFAGSNKPHRRVLSATQRAARPDDVIAHRKYLRGEPDDVGRADVRAQSVVGGGVARSARQHHHVGLGLD